MVYKFNPHTQTHNLWEEKYEVSCSEAHTGDSRRTTVGGEDYRLLMYILWGNAVITVT